LAHQQDAEKKAQTRKRSEVVFKHSSHQIFVFRLKLKKFISRLLGFDVNEGGLAPTSRRGGHEKAGFPLLNLLGVYIFSIKILFLSFLKAICKVRMLPIGVFYTQY